MGSTQASLCGQGRKRHPQRTDGFGNPPVNLRNRP